MTDGKTLSTARAEVVACAAWPGEPDPLPRVDDPDPFLARWAQLRARELSRIAFDLEASDPLGSKETWDHLRCLDPSGGSPTGHLLDSRIAGSARRVYRILDQNHSLE